MKFTKVNKDGRADKMGVKEGDVLFKVQGTEITAMHEIFGIARETEGEEIVFTMKRGQGTVDLKMKRADLRGPGRRGGQRGGQGEGEQPRGGEGNQGGNPSGGTGRGAGGQPAPGGQSGGGTGRSGNGDR
jgi:hypothetical protein